MQPFDENNIRKSFLKWENAPLVLEYDKTRILSRLSIGRVQMWPHKLMLVAAIAFILILSGTLGYALLNNRKTADTNTLLLSAQRKQEQQIQLLLDSISTLLESKQIEYITIEEEKQTPDPDYKKTQLQMHNQISQLQNENMALHTSLRQLALATDDLNDSIQKLLNNMSEIEKEYQLVINNIKPKQSFEINYDQQVLAASSDNKSITPTRQADKMEFKIGTHTSNHTTPIRRTFSFR